MAYYPHQLRENNNPAAEKVKVIHYKEEYPHIYRNTPRREAYIDQMRHSNALMK
jgi:hypothetical protein